MFHRINKAQPATWLNSTTMQIGLAQESLVIENVDNATSQLISALYSGIVSGQEQVLEQTLNLPEGKTAELISHLAPLIEKQLPTKFGPWNQLAFAEIARAAIDYQVNGEMVLAERWQRVVHIDQLDKTGLLLAKALLSAGVGKIISHDSGEVLKTDLGELGYPLTDLGANRLVCAKLDLQKRSLVANGETRLIDLNQGPRKNISVSFAVTIGHLALAPRTYSRWLARDVSHAAITYELDKTTISPVVKPGLTPCLNCQQEAVVDEFESWPIVATQLLDLPRMRDDAAALLTAVGLLTRTILRDLDEQAGFEYKADTEKQISMGYQIDYATGNVTRLSFSYHSLCSCQLRQEDSDID